VIAAALGPKTDPDELWRQVETNLAAGALRLVFVADVIPSELRAIVEFLNAQMNTTEVAAVEVRQYVAGGWAASDPRSSADRTDRGRPPSEGSRVAATLEQGELAGRPA
jgi:hypothetical protein